MNLKKGDKIGSRTVAAIKFEIPMLWAAWECDHKAWAVILDDGSKALIGTNHGFLCFLEEYDLNAKIRVYQSAISDAERAIKFLA